jgi:hypothetical protein
MVTEDCGGVREHGAFGNGSLRNLRDPRWSGLVAETSGVCWTNGTFLRKANAAVEAGFAGSTQSAEKCAHGEAAKQMKADFRETSPALTEAGA